MEKIKTNYFNTSLLFIILISLNACSPNLNPKALLNKKSLENLVGESYFFVANNKYLIVPHSYGTSLFETTTGKRILSSEDRNPLIIGNNILVLEQGEVWDLNKLEIHPTDSEKENLVIVLNQQGELKHIVEETHGWREDDYFMNYAYTVRYKTEVKNFEIQIYRTGFEECLLSIPMPSKTGGYRVKEKDNLVIVEMDHDQQWNDENRVFINLETGDVTRHIMGEISPRTLKLEPAKETVFKTNLFKEKTDGYQIFNVEDMKPLTSITPKYELPKELKGYNVLDISTDTSLFICNKIKDSDYVCIFEKSEIDKYFVQKRIRTIGSLSLAIILIVIFSIINYRKNKVNVEPKQKRTKHQKQNKKAERNNRQVKTVQKTSQKKKPQIKDEIPEESMEQMCISTSFAASLGDNEKLELYLKKGVDINTISEYGKTFLMEAIDDKRYNTVEYLLKKGANPDLCGSEIMPPLVDIAAHSGDVKFSKMLLDHGANVNITDELGFTALHYAAKYMFVELTELLIKNGADVNKKSNSGIAPVNGDATHYTDILLLLLGAGADPLNKGYNGKTTLMDAAEGNSLGSVEILINAGVDPNATDNDGNRAIDYAKQKKNHVVVNFLEKISTPAKKGLNPSMLPDNLGQPGSVPAGEEKPDIETLITSLGFTDFSHFYECFKYSPSDFTEDMQKEVSKILKEPIKQEGDTKYFYSAKGIFCYTQKNGSHDYTKDGSRVYYEYLDDLYFICINSEKDYVELIHFKWTDNITAQALDITNVTRKDKGWENLEVNEGYIQNRVKEWLSWNSKRNTTDTPKNKEVEAKFIAILKENNVDFSINNNTIIVKGELNLKGTKINKLPEGMTIEGSLDLSGESIEILPDNLTVNGNCYLSSTNISSLPENLKVGKTIGLRGTKIKSLPKSIEVGDSIGLADTLIEELPEGLSIGGDLVLADTPISKLPTGLVIGRHLDLRGTKISSLPSDLKVKGNLLIEDTNITSIPESIEIGGNIER